jgi:hypothetical protein
VQAVGLVRDKAAGVTAKIPAEWSPRQRAYRKGLGVAGGIGVFLVWTVLIYVLATEPAQPWHHAGQSWKLLCFSLFFTGQWLSLVRKQDWAPLRRHWAGLSSQLVVQSALTGLLFMVAVAGIADRYFAPPFGSRIAHVEPAPIEHAAAVADTGSSELIRKCRFPRDAQRSIEENVGAAECMRYIDGFIAGVSIVKGPRPFCIPSATTLGQEAAAYLAWADKHPEAWSQPRYVTLPKALAEAFPCGK